MEQSGAGSSSGKSRQEMKRERDRNYRRKLKEEETERKSALETFREQNEQLRQENDVLRECNALMNETLQSNDEVFKQLQAEFDKSKLQHSKENVLVHTLSDNIISADQVREENQKLMEENSELKNRIGANDELLKLIEEIARFRLENTTLQIQNDALCGEMVSQGEEE